MEIMGSGDCSLPSLTDIGAATTGSSWACIWTSNKVVSSLRRICVFLACFFCWTVHLAFSVISPLACAKRPLPKWQLHAGDSVTALSSAQGQSGSQSVPVPQTTSAVRGVSPSASLLRIPLYWSQLAPLPLASLRRVCLSLLCTC
jgi:hypothetical protein